MADNVMNTYICYSKYSPFSDDNFFEQRFAANFLRNRFPETVLILFFMLVVKLSSFQADMHYF